MNYISVIISLCFIFINFVYNNRSMNNEHLDTRSRSGIADDRGQRSKVIGVHAFALCAVTVWVITIQWNGCGLALPTHVGPQQPDRNEKGRAVGACDRVRERISDSEDFGERKDYCGERDYQF
jgi:hypothetical protein